MTNIYHHVPAFEMVQDNSYDVANGHWNYRLTGNMVPLSGDVISSRQWVDYVEFDPHDTIYQNYKGDIDKRPTYTDIGHGKWFAASGVNYEESLVHRDRNEDGKELPYGYDLDFEHCPAVSAGCCIE